MECDLLTYRYAVVSLFELMIVKPCGRELWKGVGREFGNRKERDKKGD